MRTRCLYLAASVLLLLGIVAGCSSCSTSGGGSPDEGGTTKPGGGSNDSGSSSSTADFAAITTAIQNAQSRFSGGLSVEIATPRGIVYSYSVGGFSPDTRVIIASSAKWITSTILLRLVDQGVLSLDEKMSAVLTDRNGAAWSAPMGDITLRRLLSQTSGIHGDDLHGSTQSDSTVISLAEAVNRIYDEQHAASSTQAPGSYFWYGSTHFRIAARYAEVKTGKSWEQIFAEQLRDPLGWSSRSTYTVLSATNPNPAGTLAMTGTEFMRFMMLQLRGGLDGATRLLTQGLNDQQSRHQIQPSTNIAESPYLDFGKAYHYGLGCWRECPSPSDVDVCDASLQVSSIGAFGWLPWIDSKNGYAAVIMTKQSEQDQAGPSLELKTALAALIPEVLAQNPAVIRTVP